MERSSTDLEIFSLPQATENSSQFLFPRTDILQKTVVGCPFSCRPDFKLRRDSACLKISGRLFHRTAPP